jgi:hypothetical protein
VGVPMKVLVAAVLLMVLAVGCAWTPDRDNRVDPASRFYDPPPARNRPPVIDTLRMITDCENNPFSNFCSFEVICRASDPDRNLYYDSVFSYMMSPASDSVALGILAYDPGRGEFFVRRSQNDFPGENLNDFRDYAIWAVVLDDSGATARGHIPFRESSGQWPAPVFPAPHSDYDTVYTPHPKLSWQFWNGPTGDHTFSVTVFDQYNLVVWDTAGLSARDTTTIVTQNLRSSQVIDNPYSWRLTVTDGSGDRLTSRPAYFVAWFAPLLHLTAGTTHQAELSHQHD